MTPTRYGRYRQQPAAFLIWHVLGWSHASLSVKQTFAHKCDRFACLFFSRSKTNGKFLVSAKFLYQYVGVSAAAYYLYLTHAVRGPNKEFATSPTVYAYESIECHALINIDKL